MTGAALRRAAWLIAALLILGVLALCWCTIAPGEKR